MSDESRNSPKDAAERSSSTPSAVSRAGRDSRCTANTIDRLLLQASPGTRNSYQRDEVHQVALGDLDRAEGRGQDERLAGDRRVDDVVDADQLPVEDRRRHQQVERRRAPFVVQAL